MLFSVNNELMKRCTVVKHLWKVRKIDLVLVWEVVVPFGSTIAFVTVYSLMANTLKIQTNTALVEPVEAQAGTSTGVHPIWCTLPRLSLGIP